MCSNTIALPKGSVARLLRMSYENAHATPVTPNESLSPAHSYDYTTTQ